MTLALSALCLTGCYPDDPIEDEPVDVPVKPEPKPDPDPDPTPDPDPKPDAGLSYDNLPAYDNLKN